MSALATTSRLALAALATLTLLASSRSQSQPTGPSGPAGPQPTAPMSPGSAVGLWKTNFGAVKIEQDSAGGLHGAWLYQREGRDVLGYFAGPIDGNLLRFSWREPAQAQPNEPQLGGEGWITFDEASGRFAGRWWTYDRSRQGDWSGERGPVVLPAQPAYDPYGGAGYGGAMYGGAMYGGATYGTPF